MARQSSFAAEAKVTGDGVRWTFGDMDGIAALGFVVEGAPQLVDCPFGRALAFGGAPDRLWLGQNPLAGLTRFTVEVVFRPDAGGQEAPRFLHFGQAEGDRLLFETRMVRDRHWYLDTFILSGDGDSTLLNEGYLHPVGPWYHLAVTCDGAEHVNYVDGVPERRAPVAYRPAAAGFTSVGVRLNRVCWFRGAVYCVQVTPAVLIPEQFHRPIASAD